MMPAIWRPNVSGPLPDVDVEVEVTEDASSKGTKRKRAPPTKGPCEHGVKYRSKCKVCSACPHGRQALTALGLKCKVTVRSAAGAQSASTVVSAHSARSAVGLESASTVVSAIGARSAVGLKSASTVVSALIARSAVGLQSASTVVSALRARSAVDLDSASTVVAALGARSAVGLQICEHGRQRRSVQGVRWVWILRARSSAL